jgi:hypothetical protein
MHYSSWGTPLLDGFTDFDWANDLDDHSTIGYVFSLGSRPITWDCKKLQIISISLVEVEYQETINASQYAMWLQ